MDTRVQRRDAERAPCLRKRDLRALARSTSTRNAWPIGAVPAAVARAAPTKPTGVLVVAGTWPPSTNGVDAHAAVLTRSQSASLTLLTFYGSPVYLSNKR